MPGLMLSDSNFLHDVQPPKILVHNAQLAHGAFKFTYQRMGEQKNPKPIIDFHQVVATRARISDYQVSNLGLWLLERVACHFSTASLHPNPFPLYIYE